MQTRHLTVQELTVVAEQERKLEHPGWGLYRVISGCGYLGTSVGELTLLDPGATFFADGQGEAVVRASRISDLRLGYFLLIPSHLSGFLTLSEKEFLESPALKRNTVLKRFEPTHAVSASFRDLVGRMETDHKLMIRCEMLLLVLSVLRDQIPQVFPQDSPTTTACDRFFNMVKQMSESEFYSQSIKDLARACGCSERHFSRMFRQRFRTSFLSKQIELRLQKAKRLLHETDAKIIDVALESGFRHLGLFNSMFKKRFRITPSEWRRTGGAKTASKSGKRTRRIAMVCFMAHCLGWTVGAQQSAPGVAGASPTSAVSTNVVTRFPVNSFEVEGNSLLHPDVVEKALEGGRGPAVSVDDIRKAIQKLQAEYRQRGFVTVSVTLPPQKLENAMVRVVVVQGRLSGIAVEGNRYFSSTNVLRSLPSLRENLILNSKVFQQELDRANSNPDRQIFPLIEAGKEPGTSSLTLQVKDRLPLHGRVDVNNHNTPDSPSLRINSSVSYGNLWQREHSLGLSYSFTPEEFKGPNNEFDGLMDAPLIANYGVFYRMPLGGVTAVAEEIETSGGRFGYDEASREFKLPQASGRPELTLFAGRSAIDSGSRATPERLVVESAIVTLYAQDFNRSLTINDNLGTRFSLPLNLSGSTRSTLSAGVEYKSYELHTLSTNTFRQISEIRSPLPDVPPVIIEDIRRIPQPEGIFRVDYLPATLRWDVFRPDKKGLTSGGLGYTFHTPVPSLSEERDFINATGSTDSSGTFHVISANLSREHRVYHGWSMFGRAEGQWSNEPLLSNEQFAVGGNSGVRGYYEGETYGDLGWKGTIEARSPFFTHGLVDGRVPLVSRWTVFVDYGENTVSSRGAGSRTTRLMGLGMASQISLGRSLDIRATLGFPTRETANVSAYEPRVRFSFAYQF